MLNALQNCYFHPPHEFRATPKALAILNTPLSTFNPILFYTKILLLSKTSYNS